MRNNTAKNIALGGMLAAAVLVIMCLGGLIPVATFVCPMLCAIGQHIVLRICGRRIAWAWYAAVALLSLLIGPDKEAAAIFALLGYYPILKPAFDKSKLRWLWKLLLFNGAVCVLYTVVLRLLGLETVASDYQELGLAGLIVLLILGNVTFFLLDRLLTILTGRKFRK